MSFGVMGGDMQPQGQAQIVINRVDYGLDIQAAGDSPRWHHEGSSQRWEKTLPDWDPRDFFTWNQAYQKARAAH